MYKLLIELTDYNVLDSPTGVRLIFEQGRGKSWGQRTIKVVEDWHWMRGHVVLLERGEVTGGGNKTWTAALLVEDGSWQIGAVELDAYAEDLTRYCGRVHVPAMEPVIPPYNQCPCCGGSTRYANGSWLVCARSYGACPVENDAENPGWVPRWSYRREAPLRELEHVARQCWERNRLLYNDFAKTYPTFEPYWSWAQSNRDPITVPEEDPTQ